jgi:hypothetical protein
VINRNGESGHPCLVYDFTENFQFLTLADNVNCGLYLCFKIISLYLIPSGSPLKIRILLLMHAPTLSFPRRSPPLGFSPTQLILSWGEMVASE